MNNQRAEEKARDIAGEIVDLAQTLMDMGYNISIRIQGIEIELAKSGGDNPEDESGLSEA